MEKALRCIIAKRARGTKNSPFAAERSTRRAAKTDTMYLPSSSSLSSSADSSKTSSSESAPMKTGDAITREHEKLTKLDQQLAKLLNSSRPNRKPDYLVLRNSSIKLLFWKISAKFTNRTTVNAKHNLL